MSIPSMQSYGKPCFYTVNQLLLNATAIVFEEKLFQPFMLKAFYHDIIHAPQYGTA